MVWSILNKYHNYVERKAQGCYCVARFFFCLIG